MEVGAATDGVMRHTKAACVGRVSGEAPLPSTPAVLPFAAFVGAQLHILVRTDCGWPRSSEGRVSRPSPPRGGANKSLFVDTKIVDTK